MDVTKSQYETYLRDCPDPCIGWWAHTWLLECCVAWRWKLTRVQLVQSSDLLPKTKTQGSFLLRHELVLCLQFKDCFCHNSWLFYLQVTSLCAKINHLEFAVSLRHLGTGMGSESIMGPASIEWSKILGGCWIQHICILLFFTLIHIFVWFSFPSGSNYY